VTITLRQVKGSALTHSELDGNFTDLNGRVNTAQSDADAAQSAADAHASRHASGGADPLDVTDLAGFPGGTGSFLRSDGTFAVPPGTGDVVGPGAATDHAIALFDGTTGKLLQDSAVTVSTSGSITVPNGQTVDGRDVSADGAALDSHTSNTSNPHSTTIAQVSSKLATVDALTWAADRVAYFTGAATSALATLTSFGRSILALADASAARTLFGLVPGTDVQAQDAELSAIAGLTSAADKVPYFTGSGTAALADFSAAGRALVDDADASAQRTTLGLGALATLATVGTSQIDDDAVTLAKMAAGTAGNLITYNASGDPAVVSTGTAGQVLTSNGAGAAPTFQTASGGSAASESAAGIAELATQTETDTGTDDARIVTPLKLATHAPAVIAVPSAPSAGHAREFFRSWAGRSVHSQIDELGIGGPHQIGTWNDVSWWQSSNSSILGVGIAASTTGTISAPNLANTNGLTRQRRARATTTTSNDSSAGFRCSIETAAWRGNAAGLGGFFAVFRFGTNTSPNNQRTFVGLASGTSVLGGGVNPSAFTDCVGMSHDDLAGSGNYSIIHNDASGTATSVALGADFPKDTTSAYELTLFCPPSTGASGENIQYLVRNLSTGNTASGTLSTNLPTNTVFLQPHAWVNTGAGTTACAIDMCRMYLEIPPHGDTL